MGRKRIYDLDATYRTCRICKRQLSVSNFAANQTRPSGYIAVESRCYECQAKRRRKGSPRPKNRIPRSDIIGTTDTVTINRLSKYGLTLDQFTTLYADQQGLCGICFDPLGDRYCIDHCHQSGKVRGLLCGNCNTGIGMLRDDPTLLQSALAYLTQKSFNTA